MKASNHPPHEFEQQFKDQPLHRRNFNAKKRRSWVSFILTLIALVLSAISAYHIFYKTLFRLEFLGQSVNYQQFKETIHQLTNQATIDTSQLEHNLNILLTMIHVFFILVFINIVLAILTLVFNRTLIKLLNLILAICATLIPVAILYVIREAAKAFAEKLSQYLGHVDAAALLSEANGLHNAIICSCIATSLYFISLFFRNRRPKFK
ncbi:hypothetical protein [Staphylococcus ratti]|uniref:Uncharacterized protein n=1 Tax=Staphylococcus ratti TaxID=2892440 RepID=A0ABY3PDY7_9STAP|nr:hypothetical protein [Staphylococcus ratti]UEX90486.1 hypothetical protein LN051_02120 [Staphylococcus ratti]